MNVYPPIRDAGSSRRTWPDQQGSALIGVLLVAMIVGTIAGLYLETAGQEFRQSQRSLMLQKAINVAETGAEEALYAINEGSWSGWDTVVANVHYRSFTQPTSNGRESRAYVAVDMRDTNNPVIYTAGEMEIGIRNHKVSKQLHMELGARSLFSNGLTSRNRITFSGNNTYVDSYDSRRGNYNTWYWPSGSFFPRLNLNDRGSVASTSVEVDSVVLGNADVWGYVATGGSSPKVGPNGSVRGSDTPSGVKVDPNRVAHDFYADLPSVTLPPLSDFEAVGSPGLTIINKKYHLDEWKNMNNQRVEIQGDVVLIVDGEIDIKGEIELMPGATLTIYARGDKVNVGGNGILNGSNPPQSLVLYGAPTGNQTIKFHGRGMARGAIYAPDSQVELLGGGSSGEIFGAVVGKEIKVTGTYQFHYDEALADFGGEAGYRLQYWRELREEGERLPLTDKSALINHFASH